MLTSHIRSLCLQKNEWEYKMNKTKTTNLGAIVLIALMSMVVLAVFLLTACNENFDNSTTIKQNATNTTDSQMQYTTITTKASQQVYVNWTISESAKNDATSYKLVILDNDKNALTNDNNVVNVSIYDSNKKALGTATTEIAGQYNLSAVLGDNKIAAGKYYAMLEFAKPGTYNLAIVLLT